LRYRNPWGDGASECETASGDRVICPAEWDGAMTIIDAAILSVIAERLLPLFVAVAGY